MSIAHHPHDDLLLAYAGGAADPATALIVATHLVWCGTCRAAVACMENVGGVLLDSLPPEPLGSDALNATLARLDTAPAQPRPPRSVSRDGTPAPLRAFMGRDLSDVPWRRIGPRLAYLPLMRRGPMRMRLLRGAPGTEVGVHSHHGMEYTLVLKGGFTDVTGRYGPGDFQVAASDLSHNPIADPDGDCINLAVTTAPLRFENLLQKIAAPLFGF